MIELAKSNYPSLNFFVTDLEDTFPDFNKTFDLVVMKLFLMFVENLENVAQQLSKISKVGSYIIVSVPHPTYWTAYYLQDKYGYKERPNFRILEKGYFSESAIEKTIGRDKELVFGFIHRTLITYVNTFSAYGFLVEKIDEPELTEEFLSAHPDDKDKIDIPMRLNIRLRNFHKTPSNTLRYLDPPLSKATEWQAKGKRCKC